MMSLVFWPGPQGGTGSVATKIAGCMAQWWPDGAKGWHWSERCSAHGAGGNGGLGFAQGPLQGALSPFALLRGQATTAFSRRELAHQGKRIYIFGEKAVRCATRSGVEPRYVERIQRCMTRFGVKRSVMNVTPNGVTQRSNCIQ